MDRINKFLAHAGLGSRRHCEDLIREGRVQVDGRTVREFATRVMPGQTVTVDKKPIASEPFVYWLVHKPAGYLCTNNDPGGRPLAIELVPEVPQRVYTVGRLDEESEGLLLLTNDGDLANRLTHPRYGIEKTYHVQVAGNPTRDDIQRLLKGVWLSVGRARAVRVHKLKQQGNSTWLEVVLAEGKNREIRRMLARLDHKVMRLIRRAIGPIEMGRLKSGQSRPLLKNEINRLRRAAEQAAAMQSADIPEE
jgi:23S rRNA pseudouridine2605 synthase